MRRFIPLHVGQQHAQEERDRLHGLRAGVPPLDLVRVRQRLEMSRFHEGTDDAAVDDAAGSFEGVIMLGSARERGRARSRNEETEINKQSGSERDERSRGWHKSIMLTFPSVRSSALTANHCWLSSFACFSWLLRMSNSTSRSASRKLRVPKCGTELEMNMMSPA
jgi:hypothetical protein